MAQKNEIAVRRVKYCGIYMLINNFNGKQYIGQSKDIVRRFWEHKSQSKTKNTDLYADIRRIGFDNFTLIILEECMPEELDEKEIFYISKFKPEYNKAIGGKGCSGIKKTEAQKEVSRQAALKQWAGYNEEQRKHILKNLGNRKGHYVSEETKQRLREARIGTKWSEETRVKIAETKRIKKENGYVQTNAGHKKKIKCVNDGKIYESVKQAGEILAIDPSSISCVLHGKYKSTHGYSFVYEGRS